SSDVCSSDLICQLSRTFDNVFIQTYPFCNAESVAASWFAGLQGVQWKQSFFIKQHCAIDDSFHLICHHFQVQVMRCNDSHCMFPCKFFQNNFCKCTTEMRITPATQLIYKKHGLPI